MTDDRSRALDELGQIDGEILAREMTDIPQDILDVSRKLCDDLIQAWLLHHSREEAAEIAVKALLSERLRCAKIADDEADKLKLRDGPDKRRDPLNKQIVAMKVVCRDIAASIRRAP